MTHSAQGSFATLRLPRRWARVAIAAMLMLSGSIGAVYSVDVSAQERDRMVIRGPAGAEQADVRIGTERYGPIKATDTLWSIASQHRPHSSVAVPQVMSALVQANPEAFRNNNPSEMLTGFYLRIPSLQEIQMMNPEAARRQVELGQQLERQQRALTAEQQLTNQRREEQDQLVKEARTRTEQVIEDVRARHEQEFIDLRENLLRSIQGTEAVVRDNEELKERLLRLENLLVALQEGVVSAAEYEAEIGELKTAQENLRREQNIVSARTQEKTVVEELLDHPAALVLLASVPALLMILLTTWLLRRRQIDISEHALLTETKLGREEERELSDEEARDALERELMGGITAEEDDLLSDDPFAGFDDDEGADLDRLSDEMLMPSHEAESEDEDDFGIRLDDSEEEIEGSDFSALEEDFDAPDERNIGATEDIDSDVNEVEKSATSSDALGQDDLDRLLMGADDDDEESEDEAVASMDATDANDTVDMDDIDALLDSVGAESSDAVEEPIKAAPDDELLPEEPSDVDPFDPDVLLDQVQQAQQADDLPAAEASSDENDELEDIDIDELFDELGIDDEHDEDISLDDIDVLLAEADDAEVEDELETAGGFDELAPDLVFGDDDDHEDGREADEEEEGDESLGATDDDEDDQDLINLAELEPPEFTASEELEEDADIADSATESETEIDFKSLAADEELDEELFELDDDELAQAAAEAESELESLFGEQPSENEDDSDEQDTQQDSSETFLDIDDIIAAADDEIELGDDDDEDEDDSLRAEDQLAAQLDLARAYLEMDEIESAREAIQEVLDSDDETLRAEAEKLLKRIDN